MSKSLSMKFFSGFCLGGEEILFEEYMNHSHFSVAGFSYGAIKALKYALEHKGRIDKLFLLSPAFYSHTTTEFKQQQLEKFKANPIAYQDKFLSIGNLYGLNISPYKKLGELEELEELLSFKWRIEDFDLLLERNIRIEVFLGGKDRVVDVEQAKQFFSQMGTLFFIKDGDHFLNY